ncbi:MAG TPA: hypothetical protein VGQ57_17200, partial [Polyangiaceae bacterium]|nr:hypothetical protein [Polyangiaceae bacterium]
MSAAASQTKQDPHVQLRRLYTSLLEEQHRFDEFKQLLSLYPVSDGDEESGDAQSVRSQLNARINEWLCGHFDGLSATQVALWRS